MTGPQPWSPPGPQPGPRLGPQFGPQPGPRLGPQFGPRQRLHDVAALWSARLAWPADVVRAACAVLPDGGDTLAMPAGPPEATVDDTDVEPLLQAALADVGLAYHPPGSGTVLDHAVAAKTRELLAGTITPLIARAGSLP